MRDRLGPRPRDLSDRLIAARPMTLDALLATSALVVPSIASAQPSSVTPIGYLHTTAPRNSNAQAISADAPTVVGWSTSDLGVNRAFRWTAAGGIADLGSLNGGTSSAFDVSGDGALSPEELRATQERRVLQQRAPSQP